MKNLPELKEIEQKKYDFQNDFMKYAKQKIATEESISFGLIESKVDLSFSILEHGADWTGAGINLIPVVGPFIALGFKAVQDFARFQGKRSSQKKADELVKLLHAHSNINAEIEIILEEVAFEVTRISEYQISRLNKNGITQMAQCAVDRMFHYGLSNKTAHYNFDRNHLLEGIYSPSHTVNNKTIVTIDNKKWNNNSIFTKPGLRKESSKQPCEFLLRAADKKSEKTNAIKYGYRNPILHLTNVRTYTICQLDRAYMQPDKSENTHKAYIPLNFIITHTHITEYLSNPLNYSIPFNQYIAHNYRPHKDFPVISVFRNPSLEKIKTLKNGNFSNIDFNYADLQGVNAKRATFNNCRFIHANLTDAMLQETKLRQARLDFTTLFGTRFKGADLLQTNLNYAEGNESTNLESLTSNLGLTMVGASFGNALAYKTEPGKKIDTAEVISNVDKSILVDFYHNSEADSTLKEKLQKQHCVVITGVRGAGKRQLTTHFALHHNSTLTWVFSGNTDDQLEQHYREFAAKLGMKRAKNASIHKIHAFLEKRLLNTKDGFLLIFENIANPQQVANFLPSDEVCKKGNGKLMITTSNLAYDYPEEGKLKLEGFSKEAALKFLLRKENLSDQQIDEDFSLLLKQLGSLPLGLAVAKGFINHVEGKQLTLRQYSAMLTEEKNIEVEQLAATRTALLLTINTLKKKNPAAYELLKRMAFMEEKNIPLAVVTEETSEKALTDLVHSLASASLVSFDRDKCTKEISLNNSLIQQVILFSLKEAEKKECIEKNLAKLQAMFTKDTREKVNFERNLALQPHVIKTLDYAKAWPSTAEIKLLDVLAYFYSQQGLAKQSKTIFARALHLCEQIAEIRAEDKAHTELLYNKLLKADKQLPKLYASILYSFGRVYFYTKEVDFFAEARSYLELSFAINQEIDRVSGGISLGTVLSQRNGLLYLQLDSKQEKDLIKAVKEYASLLATNASTNEMKPLREDVYHQLICHHQLARAWHKLGKLRADNSEAPTDEVSSAYNLALGYVEKAIDLTKTSKTDWERLADYLNTKAAILLDPHNPISNPDLAAKFYRDAYAIEYRKNKRDFPQADACIGLANYYSQVGPSQNISKAYEYASFGLEIRKDIYPATHPLLKEAEQLTRSLAKILETSHQKREELHQPESNTKFTARLQRRNSLPNLGHSSNI